MVINKMGIVPHRQTICWSGLPHSLDYSHAHSYLQILTSPEKASEIVDRLIDEYEVQHWNSGRILRAAGLFPSAMPNEQVNKVIREINSKQPLSPVLLVRDARNRRIHIAHGYEVIAGVNHHDPNASVACHVTAWDCDAEKA